MTAATRPDDEHFAILLRCVNALEAASSGTVTVDGVQLTDPDTAQ